MSYRSAWRRFRWRHGGNWDWISTLNFVYYLAMVLCWLEWLHPGSIAPILVQISSVVWPAFMVILLLAHPFIWLVNRVASADGPQFPETCRMMKWYGGMPALFSLGFQIGALWMFFLHRLDGALLCGSLWTLFFVLKNGWDRKDGSAILRAFAEALLMMAALLHSGGWQWPGPLLVRSLISSYDRA